MPNSFHSEVLLGKEDGIFKPIPEDIFNARPLYTGTAAVVGNKGKALGTRVESQCDFEGSRKTVYVKFDEEYADLVDVLLMCNHGFAPDGKTPLLPLSNARTGKQICTDDEMREAYDIFLNLNGQKRAFKIKSRDGGAFETVGDENTFTWISDSATIGLLRRCVNFLDYRHNVSFADRPSERLGVVMEAAGVTVAAGNGTTVLQMKG